MIVLIHYLLFKSETCLVILLIVIVIKMPVMFLFLKSYFDILEDSYLILSSSFYQILRVQIL
jgi:hypothetical protein